MTTLPTPIPTEKRCKWLRSFLLEQLGVIEELRAKNPSLVPEGLSLFLYITYPWFGDPATDEQKEELTSRRARVQSVQFDGDAVVKRIQQLLHDDPHLRECCPTVGDLVQFVDNFFIERALQFRQAGESMERVERFYEEEFVPLTYDQGPFMSFAVSHLFNFDSSEKSMRFPNVRLEKLDGQTVAAVFGERSIRSFFHPFGTGDFFVVSERGGQCDDWISWLFDEKHKAEQFAMVLQYFKDGVVYVDYTVPYFFPEWVNHIRRRGVYYLGTPRRYPYADGKQHYLLSRDEIADVADWWKAYTSPEVTRRLAQEDTQMRQAGMRAGEYFELNHKQEGAVARLIALAISLESLFTPRDHHGELTFRISQCASQLVGRTKEERTELFKALKGFYRKRSDLFHGRYDVQDYYNEEFVTHEECDRWASIIRRAILQFLVLFLRGENNRETVLNDLINAALDPSLGDGIRQRSSIQEYLDEFRRSH